MAFLGGNDFMIKTKGLIAACLLCSVPTWAEVVSIDFENGQWHSGFDNIVFSKAGSEDSVSGIEITDKFVRQGKLAARFWREADSGRMEHGYDRLHKYTDGSHKFYRASYFIDPNSTLESRKNGTIFQLKHTGLPLGKGTAKCIAVNTDGKSLTLDVRHYHPQQQRIRNKHTLLAELPVGRWFDIVVESKWSNKADGFYRVFVREQGSDKWQKQFEQLNITTLANPKAPKKPVKGYFKVGTYAGPKVTVSKEIYLDDIRIADSFIEATAMR
ncbi:heparin lyase I family protein [Paraferrimonas sp. SM1919]|uniref:heparin lyase I family protein n=1 Tax=Paraferrimonas sp. SM1919 TaxID=2662263 RepID=UPI0013D870A3|nr:heparin lyase I family protein [Paraferrimonas sp. SM1919]